jgi:hypothetical protein
MADTLRLPEYNLSEVGGASIALTNGALPVKEFVAGTVQPPVCITTTSVSAGGIVTLTIPIPNAKTDQVLMLGFGGDSNFRCKLYTDADGSTPVKRGTWLSDRSRAQNLDLEKMSISQASTGTGAFKLEFKNLDKNTAADIDAQLSVRRTDT